MTKRRSAPSLNSVSPVNSDPGVDCWDTHKGRLCQSLEGKASSPSTVTGLQLTTGPIDPPPDDQIPAVQYATVTCGSTLDITLYNNTCANESEVTLNGLRGRLA